MTTPAGAIKNYEALTTLTASLREAAARGEWAQLTEIQQQRTALVATMTKVDATVALDAAARNRKDELIRQILADEAETRERVRTWMAQLDCALQEGRKELRLVREYQRLAG